MIANQKQHKITVDRLNGVKQDLSKFDELALISAGIDPVILTAQRRSLESEALRLERDIERYIALRDGQVDALHSSDIAGLGLALIEARLALGLTQKELGARLHLKEQQIQRYEQDRYQTASLSRLQEVIRALDADTSVEMRLSQSASRSAEQFDPRLLPIREMKKRGWLEDIRLPDETPRTDAALADHFMRVAFAGASPTALHKQRVRLGGKVNPYAVTAWKGRVLQIARTRKITKNYHSVDALFIRHLVGLSADPKGPLLAVDALESKGIAVVIESHLTGTHLDGAAMLLDNKTPVIALTLRHDRLDNFWFVLLHELAHVVCHRDKGLAEGFFDDEAASSLDDLEIEADNFALNALISNEIWNTSFVRFTKSRDQVIAFAKKLGIGPSIVAGRIRHERKDYTLFNDLVGGKEVKALFSDEAG